MLDDQVKAEMHQAVVEVGTGICNNVEEARKDLSNLRLAVAQIAHDQEVQACSGRYASFIIGAHN
ncbi:MAG: hypothetical protein R2850_05760 [Bacteroidia bacterium]